MDALPHYTSRQKIIDAQDLDKPHPAQIKLSYKWPFQRNRLLVQLAAKRSEATRQLTFHSPDDFVLLGNDLHRLLALVFDLVLKRADLAQLQAR